MLDAPGGCRLGALQRRSLGLGTLLGMDLDFLRALGLGALPLWPLVHVWRPLGWWPARGFGGGMWSPAYVSFFGFGGRGFGVGFGFGLARLAGWRWVRVTFSIPGSELATALARRALTTSMAPAFIRAGGPRFGSNLETMRTDAHVRAAVRNVSSQEFASGRMGHSMPVSEGMLHNASMMRGVSARRAHRRQHRHSRWKHVQLPRRWIREPELLLAERRGGRTHGRKCRRLWGAVELKRLSAFGGWSGGRGTLVLQLAALRDGKRTLACDGK